MAKQLIQPYVYFGQSTALLTKAVAIVNIDGKVLYKETRKQYSSFNLVFDKTNYE